MDLEQEICLWQLSKRAHISAVQLKLYSKLNHFVSVLYMNKELDSNVLNTIHEDCHACPSLQRLATEYYVHFVVLLWHGWSKLLEQVLSPHKNTLCQLEEFFHLPCHGN